MWFLTTSKAIITTVQQVKLQWARHTITSASALLSKISLTSGKEEGELLGEKDCFLSHSSILPSWTWVRISPFLPFTLFSATFKASVWLPGSMPGYAYQKGSPHLWSYRIFSLPGVHQEEERICTQIPHLVIHNTLSLFHVLWPRTTQENLHLGQCTRSRVLCCQPSQHPQRHH